MGNNRESLNKSKDVGIRAVMTGVLALGVIGVLESSCKDDDNSSTNTPEASRTNDPTTIVDESFAPTISPIGGLITETPPDEGIATETQGPTSTQEPTNPPKTISPPEPTPTKPPVITPRPTQVWTPAPTTPPTVEPTLAPTAEPTPSFEDGPNYELSQGSSNLINQERQELGINQLTTNSALISAAHEYAKFLFDNHIFGHDLDGLTPIQRAEKYGYEGGWVGDILIIQSNFPGDTYFAPERLVQGWKDSPPHYGAMIDKNYRYIGVGCYQGFNQITERDIVVCVGNLGNP